MGDFLKRIKRAGNELFGDNKYDGRYANPGNPHIDPAYNPSRVGAGFNDPFQKYAQVDNAITDTVGGGGRGSAPNQPTFSSGTGRGTGPNGLPVNFDGGRGTGPNGQDIGFDGGRGSAPNQPMIDEAEANATAEAEAEKILTEITFDETIPGEEKKSLLGEIGKEWAGIDGRKLQALGEMLVLQAQNKPAEAVVQFNNRIAGIRKEDADKGVSDREFAFKERQFQANLTSTGLTENEDGSFTLSKTSQPTKDQLLNAKKAGYTWARNTAGDWALVKSYDGDQTDQIDKSLALVENFKKREGDYSADMWGVINDAALNGNYDMVSDMLKNPDKWSLISNLDAESKQAVPRIYHQYEINQKMIASENSANAHIINQLTKEFFGDLSVAEATGEGNGIASKIFGDVAIGEAIRDLTKSGGSFVKSENPRLWAEMVKAAGGDPETGTGYDIQKMEGILRETRQYLYDGLAFAGIELTNITGAAFKDSEQTGHLRQIIPFDGNAEGGANYRNVSMASNFKRLNLKAEDIPAFLEEMRKDTEAVSAQSNRDAANRANWVVIDTDKPNEEQLLTLSGSAINSKFYMNGKIYTLTSQMRELLGI